jgi:nicotinate-nucleotide adenylyltransferase
MSDKSSSIGIFGGTFNPIHFGHLIIAEAVREAFGLERVLFVPLGIPPHKSYNEIIGAEHRYGMVECAVRSNPYFEASRVEIDRSGYTYTVDTLKALRSRYGGNAGLYFIIGADVINELTTWKNFTEVFGLCRFIAVNRPGFDAAQAKSDVARLTERYAVSVDIIEAPLVDISSTAVRERVKAHRSIKYLVPECIEEYIYNNGLYQGEGTHLQSP